MNFQESIERFFHRELTQRFYCYYFSSTVYCFFYSIIGKLRQASNHLKEISPCFFCHLKYVAILHKAKLLNMSKVKIRRFAWKDSSCNLDQNGSIHHVWYLQICHIITSTNRFRYSYKPNALYLKLVRYN